MSTIPGEDHLLCRGAIAFGPLYHQNGVVFGKGLVKAYSLEIKVAIHPRIIVPDEFYKKLRTFDKKVEPGISLPSETLLQDSDGIWFINPFFFLGNGFIPENYIKELRIYRKTILNGLEDPSNKDNVSILSKYRWLAFRFNSALLKTNLKIKPLRI